LSRVEVGVGWTVTGAGALPYHGQALQISATVTSDTPDPNSSNNTFAMSLSGLGTGLPKVSGTSGGGCQIGSRGRAMALPLLAVIGILFVRHRRRRVGHGTRQAPL
jgi:hypothetical protein